MAEQHRTAAATVDASKTHLCWSQSQLHSQPTHSRHDGHGNRPRRGIWAVLRLEHGPLAPVCELYRNPAGPFVLSPTLPHCQRAGDANVPRLPRSDVYTDGGVATAHRTAISRETL